MGRISEEHKEALRRARRRDQERGTLFGGKAGRAKQKESALARKGKTYAEIYGPDRAEEEARKRKEGNIGVPHPPPSLEVIARISATRRGKTYAEIYGEERAQEEASKRSEAHKERALRVGRKADQRPLHNGSWEYVEWRRAVFTRDNYTCQRCSSRGDLHAHHIKPWSKFPDLRYVVENGITLCPDCHKEEHRR